MGNVSNIICCDVIVGSDSMVLQIMVEQRKQNEKQQVFFSSKLVKFIADSDRNSLIKIC